MVLFCVSYGASMLNSIAWNAGSVSILWPTTGLLIGMLLCLPHRHWAPYLVSCFLLELVIGKLFLPQVAFFHAVALAGCNVTEAMATAWVLYPTIAPERELTKPIQLVRFLLYGVTMAPAVASLVASCFLSRTFTGPNLHDFLKWYPGDALGISVATPLYLAFEKQSPFLRRRWFEIAFLFSLLCSVSVLVFWQRTLPVLFLVFPFLLLMEVRMGLAGSSMGLLAVSVIGGYFTTRAHGPISLTHLATLSQHTYTLQFFAFVCMIFLYIVDVALAEKSRSEAKLRASEQRFRLIAENSQDIILLQDYERKRLYVSPAVETLLGWKPEEYLVLTREQIIHPDDLLASIELYEQCRRGREVNKLDYRCMKKNGDYLWVEGKVALHRDPDTGAPVGFINVLRDIASRKATEAQLSKALDEAESLSTSDPLTGIANRRGFDDFLDNEWRRGIRTRTPMSLLMVDVDQFKRFNDLYGHLSGDECLKQIASAMRLRLQRTTDLLARYGGEEFVVVLPNTDNHAALTIAEEIRRGVELQQIPHEGSPHRVVTVSIGCATQVPERRAACTQLLESADEAVYAAKASGRNCVKAAFEGVLQV